jgi:outer membrane protein TolC
MQSPSALPTGSIRPVPGIFALLVARAMLVLAWLVLTGLGPAGPVQGQTLSEAPPQEVHPHEPLLRADPGLTLADLVRETAARAPGQFDVEGRSQAASLLDRASRRWLSDQPVVSGDYLTDSGLSGEGYRQWDAMLELPVWWPGQRAPRRDLARASHSAVTASSTVQLLESAGRVRSALATLALTRNQLELAQAEWQAESELADRVRRAAELGEVSQREQLLAESETLARELEYLAAVEEARHAEESYRILTGRDQWPAEWGEEPAPATDVEQHPLVELARAEIASAEADLRRLERAGWGSPTIQIGRQSEREERGVAFNDRFVAGIQIPIGRGGRAELDQAAARRVLSAARRDAARLDRDLREYRARVEHQLELAHQRVATSAEQAAIAQRHLELTERGHALGEVDLATLLRARARRIGAERARREAEIRRLFQIAEWNQALGVIP